MARPLEQERRRHTRLLWIGAALLCLAPVIGIGGTVLGMVQSFGTIESMPAPTPADLQKGVDNSLNAWGIALALVLFGAGFFLPALIKLGRLRKLSDSHAQAQ